MTDVIVIGHGGYGTAVKNVLGMLMGAPAGMLFVDFNQEDDLNVLTRKIEEALSQCGADVLFACDIAGGSPFRQCAMRCLERPGCVAVAGLNVAAIAEMSFQLTLPPGELAELAMEATRSSVMRFPAAETAQG